MSGISLGTALLIGGGVGAASSIGGAMIGANAADNAASTQANAADRSAELQYQASQAALGEQQRQYNQNQANLAPWLETGRSALSNLGYQLGVSPQGGVQQGGADQPMSASAAPGMALSGPNGAMSGPMTGIMPGAQNGPPGGGVDALTSLSGPAPSALPPPNTSLGGFGSLMQAYPGGQFQAPNGLTEQNDPGYQARLQLGTDAMQHSAAASGGLLTGGTERALNQFGQDYASNEYGNVYNRAYNQYATNYNQFQQQQTNGYNRLASLAGVGQQTASQMGLMGQNSVNAISNNLLGTAQNVGQQYNNAAAATASGYVGAGNAYSGALGGIGNNITNLLLMQGMMGGSGGGGVPVPGQDIYEGMA